MRQLLYPDEVTMNFITNLKALRMKKNLSRKEIARIIGISRVSVQLYETGKGLPGVHVLIRLAEILGVDLSSSINYRYCYNQVRKDSIMQGMKRYGLSYRELGEMLGHAHTTIKVAIQEGKSLKVLSQVLDVIEDERRRSKFRSNLLRKGGNK